MTNISISSQTIDYMKTLPVGEEFTFTARNIATAMKLEDDGPITGLMSRLKDRGFIKEVGREGRASIYTITGDLNDYRVHKAPSIGGMEGRSTTGTSRKTRIINSLLALASEIEKMKGDLSDFTTKEILHEIEKRTNKDG